MCEVVIVSVVTSSLEALRVTRLQRSEPTIVSQPDKNTVEMKRHTQAASMLKAKSFLLLAFSVGPFGIIGLKGGVYQFCLGEGGQQNCCLCKI